MILIEHAIIIITIIIMRVRQMKTIFILFRIVYCKSVLQNCMYVLRFFFLHYIFLYRISVTCNAKWSGV